MSDGGDLYEEILADLNEGEGVDRVAVAKRLWEALKTTGEIEDVGRFRIGLDVFLLLANQKDDDVRYPAYRWVSRALKYPATAAIQPGDGYAAPLAEVVFGGLKSDQSNKIRSCAALALKRLPDASKEQVDAEKTIDLLSGFVADYGGYRPRARRAIQALLSFADEDDPHREYARAALAERADVIRDQLSNSDKMISRSVALKALGVISLSHPAAALPAGPVVEEAVDDEVRGRNRNRAIRSCWQIARTYPAVAVELVEEFDCLLDYSADDAESAPSLSKDEGNFEKYARFVRSNTAKLVAVLASQRPADVPASVVERCVELIEDRDAATHRCLLAIGEVSDEHDGVLRDVGAADAVRAYLREERRDPRTAKRHTKARGYAVWVLYRVAGGTSPSNRGVSETDLEYFLDTPRTEKTGFTSRCVETVRRIAEESPKQIAGSERVRSVIADGLAHREASTRTEAAAALEAVARSGANLTAEDTDLLRTHFDIEDDPTATAGMLRALATRGNDDRRRELLNRIEPEDPLEVRRVRDALGARETSHRPHPSVPTDNPAPSAADLGPWLAEGVRRDCIEKLEPISSGGTGAVWKARLLPPTDADFGVTPIVAALKRPRPPEGGTFNSDRLQSRIDVVDRWRGVHDHPNTVTVYGAGFREDVWILMEYCDGGELGRWADEHHVSVDFALWVGVRIADTLAHAHRSGTYHLDISPRNILLSETDAWPTPKLADWGTARARHELSHGDVGHTPYYAAPEQRGAGMTKVDNPAKVDLYQLAAVVYELLAGSRPYPDDGHRAARPKPPSEMRSLVPSGIDDAVTQALSPESSDRQEDIPQFRRALEQHLY